MNSKTGKGFLIYLAITTSGLGVNMLQNDPKDIFGLALIGISVISIVIREYVKK